MKEDQEPLYVLYTQMFVYVCCWQEAETVSVASRMQKDL